MARINVGDTVEIVNDNAAWNGTIATVKSIGADRDYPYELVIVKPVSAYRRAGENIDGWPAYNLRVLRDRSAVDETIDREFPRRIEVFYNEDTGNAVVLDPHGKFVRVLADGTVDLP